MLYFASPAALLALAGLLLPLAIHLWNRQPGRVVPVGALRWLTAGASRRMRRLYLTQWPLLLLRLLIVGLVAALLAGPRWAQPPRPARPQVLVSPEVLAAPAWAVLRPAVDSLRRRGAELRAFAPGFPLLADTQAIRAAARHATRTATDWYWPRAAEAVDSFLGQPIYLYTSANRAHFRGTRPALPPRVHWQLVPTAPDSGAWLQAASRPTPNMLRLTVGRGNNLRTTFRTVQQPWPAEPTARVTLPGLPALDLQQQGGSQVIKPAVIDSTTAPQPNVKVQLPLRVGLYYDATTRREDARYLRAALRAAASALPAGLQLQERPLPATPAVDSLDWLFWLSDAPVPSAVAARIPQGLQLWRDAVGPGQVLTTTFQPPGTTAPLQLHRRAAASAAPAAVLWNDATSQPVLTLTPNGQGGTYQLYTRLHPQWSSLPDAGELPALLLELLAPAPAPVAEFRTLSADQLTGPASRLTEPQLRPRTAYTDLRPWAALAAGLLFALERLLARRRPALAPASV
ncbi:BatA domain-containing protein [Hymenobacter sp. CRA2]|uniref:BatA domain-containing protein n=1 Tax=Hymenobacter sp. CRA2 TaxID=1955620 RepID=UPI0009D224F9|nr:BatA domain-containing protein [Hymenobacter sp. CRA2]OON70766.1 hypothetical protein B0919_01775 [Hymenobacter sp. CRA2]